MERQNDFDLNNMRKLNSLNLDEMVVSGEAQQKAEEILDKFPRDCFERIGIFRMEPRLYLAFEGRLGVSKMFYSTSDERKIFEIAARNYNFWYGGRNFLSCFSGGFSAEELCQTFYNGFLRYNRRERSFKSIFQYRELISFDIYCDTGWGLFIANLDTLNQHLAEKTEDYVNLPLNIFDAIVFPTPAADVLKTEFPDYKEQIKGYMELANYWGRKTSPFYLFWKWITSRFEKDKVESDK